MFPDFLIREQAEEIVPVGSLSPNAIHVPGIYVNRIVQSTHHKEIENLVLSLDPNEKSNSHPEEESVKDFRRTIARRAAKELKDGFYANLGVGIPTLVADHLPAGVKVWFQSENGILGMGPAPTQDQLDA